VTDRGAPERPQIASASVVIDCADPVRLVDWWHELTGWPVGERREPWSDLERPDGTYLGFQEVPESKAGKNRLHLDLKVADEEDAATWAQEQLGATFLWRSQSADDPFVVLADPEGNEFCFVRAD
jgi:catechol 2,3-dioxygenase-like lactoylglutathione lyase family enzyme